MFNVNYTIAQAAKNEIRALRNEYRTLTGNLGFGFGIDIAPGTNGTSLWQSGEGYGSSCTNIIILFIFY